MEERERERERERGGVEEGNCLEHKNACCLQIPGRTVLGYISTGVQQGLKMHMGNTLHYIGLLHSITSEYK